MSPFESKKEFVVPWIITLALIPLLFLSGCDYYDEGDVIAEESFSKMNMSEKSMYDAVEEEWGQSRLLNIRKAVATREATPLESSIPFIDIANVIKSNNDLTLKVDDAWRTDAKNDAIAARWDRLDNKWYLKIIQKLGMKEDDIQLQEFVVEEVIPDKPPIVTEILDDNDYDSTNETPEEKEYFDTRNDIILLEDYDDLYYSLRGCKPAIDKYGTMIEERLITKGDREWLLQIATKCKAEKIGAKLRK